MSTKQVKLIGDKGDGLYRPAEEGNSYLRSAYLTSDIGASGDHYSMEFSEPAMNRLKGSCKVYRILNKTTETYRVNEDFVKNTKRNQVISRENCNNSLKTKVGEAKLYYTRDQNRNEEELIGDVSTEKSIEHSDENWSTVSSNVSVNNIEPIHQNINNKKKLGISFNNRDEENNLEERTMMYTLKVLPNPTCLKFLPMAEENTVLVNKDIRTQEVDIHERKKKKARMRRRMSRCDFEESTDSEEFIPLQRDFNDFDELISEIEQNSKFLGLTLSNKTLYSEKSQPIAKLSRFIREIKERGKYYLFPDNNMRASKINKQPISKYDSRYLRNATDLTMESQRKNVLVRAHSNKVRNERRQNIDFNFNSSGLISKLTGSQRVSLVEKESDSDCRQTGGNCCCIMNIFK